MAERMQLEYEVSVTGLGEAAITAENASRSAEQAINAARLAVEQTSKAIEDLDPRAAMYGFLNMMQVVRNLTSLMTMLKESTGAASAAQAILATLTGRWWLIPLALTAGALIYAKINKDCTEFWAHIHNLREGTPRGPGPRQVDEGARPQAGRRV